jgi:hypothetical protein
MGFQSGSATDGERVCPERVDEVVQTVRLRVPEPPSTVALSKLAAALSGTPLTFRLTVPVKVVKGDTDTMKLAQLPTATFCRVGVTEIEKLGAGTAVNMNDPYTFILEDIEFYRSGLEQLYCSLRPSPQAHSLS